MFKLTLATIVLWMLLPVVGMAQNTIPVSSTGIGDIKVNMTHDQVQKLLATPVTITKANKEIKDWDTVQVSYKDILLTLVFTWHYIEEGKGEARIYSIEGSHALLATRSGITQGADKFDVVKKLDGYILEIMPDWRHDKDKDKKRYAVVSLSDGDNGTMLYMYFTDNKLTGFMVTLFEGC